MANSNILKSPLPRLVEKELMAGFVKQPYRPNELVWAVEDALPRRR